MRFTPPEQASRALTKRYETGEGRAKLVMRGPNAADHAESMIVDAYSAFERMHDFRAQFPIPVPVLKCSGLRRKTVVAR